MTSSRAAAVLILLPAVTARRSGGGAGGGGSSDVDNSTFDAPPLEIANLAANSILLLASLILFWLPLRSPSYKSAGLPAALVVLALIVGGVPYALNVALVIATYTVTDMGLPSLSRIALFHLQIASHFFYNFTDVAIFVAIALVLRNRYLSTRSSSPGLIWFTCMASFLLIMMVVFLTANEGIDGAAVQAVFHLKISDPEANSHFTTASNLFFVFVALRILGAVFLAISAFLVKARKKDDRVMTLTLFVIIPLFSLYSLARLISDVIGRVLPLSDSFTMEVSIALDFSSTVVYGVMHTAILFMLVFLINRPHLWGTCPLSMQSAPLTQGPPLTQGTPSTRDTSTSQFFVMGAPSGQGSPPAEGALHNMLPGPQIPGQWRNLQQPRQAPQTGSPQPQEYVYVPVYLIQSPGVSTLQTNLNVTQAPPV